MADRPGVTKHCTETTDPMGDTRVRVYIFREQITKSCWSKVWELWDEEYERDAYGVEQLTHRSNTGGYGTEEEALQALYRKLDVISNARALG